MKILSNIVHLIYKFMKKMNKDRVRAHAAEAAFFIMMSVFPMLMILLTLVQFTPLTETEVVMTIESITPFEVSGLLQPMVQSIFDQSTALLSWSAITTIWVAGKGVMGLTDGLNSIYRIDETRNYFAIRFRAACYTFVLIVSLVISLGILVFGYTLQRYLRKWIPLLRNYPNLMMLMPTAIALVVLMLLFLVMYMFLPNRRRKCRTQIPGAIFTAIAWAVFSYAFSIYLDYAGNMSVLYGSLTTLVVVMLWLYSCMYLFFLGAEINHYLAHPELF
jgi:membrane protein